MAETFRSDRQQVGDLRAALNANPLHGATQAQADAWIDANVTTIAGARAALKILAEYIIILDHALPYLINKAKE